MKVISIPEMASQIRQRRNGKTFLAKFIQQCSIEDAIIIPNNATNGDVIKALFPSCELKEPMCNGCFEMYFDNILWNVSYMRVEKSWWDAPYGKELEE